MEQVYDQPRQIPPSPLSQERPQEKNKKNLAYRKRLQKRLVNQQEYKQRRPATYTGVDTGSTVTGSKGVKADTHPSNSWPQFNLPIDVSNLKPILSTQELLTFVPFLCEELITKPKLLKVLSSEQRVAVDYFSSYIRTLAVFNEAGENNEKLIETLLKIFDFCATFTEHTFIAKYLDAITTEQ